MLPSGVLDSSSRHHPPQIPNPSEPFSSHVTYVIVSRLPRHSVRNTRERGPPGGSEQMFCCALWLVMGRRVYLGFSCLYLSLARAQCGTYCGAAVSQFSTKKIQIRTANSKLLLLPTVTLPKVLTTLLLLHVKDHRDSLE